MVGSKRGRTASLGMASIFVFWNAMACAAWVPPFEIHRDVLKNGLTVLFVEDHSVPIVNYTTWVKVGSERERTGESGIAHLFEHLMFKGTERFPGDAFSKLLEGKGAFVNAMTERGVTTYYEVFSAQHLELVIRLEADRMANLTLTQAGLDIERKIVKEERRLRLEASFGGQQWEALAQAAFPGHPYGRPVIGSHEDLERLTLKQCRDFFRSYYQPGNLFITIAGDFEYGKAKSLIEKYYGSMSGAKVSPLHLDDVKPAGHEITMELRRPVKGESVIMGYRIPSRYDPDSQVLQLLTMAAFGIPSNRATQRLVREKRVFLGISAESASENLPYLLTVSADVRPGISGTQAMGELDRFIEDIREKGISEEELSRVKNLITFAIINEAKSASGITGWLASGEVFFGDYLHVAKVLERWRSMVPADLKRVAGKYMTKENRVVVWLRPEAGQK